MPAQGRPQQDAALDLALRTVERLSASARRYGDLVCDVALDTDLDLTPGLTSDLAHELARDLARDLEIARGCSRLNVGPERLRDLDRARACHLEGDLRRARNLARHLASDVAGDQAREPDISRRRERDLVHAIDAVAATASAEAGRLRERRDALLLEQVLPQTGVAPSSRKAPGRLTRHLVAQAVRLLPAQHHDRYDAEWRGELGELPRRARLGYAVRLLLQTREMRRALAFVPADGLEQQAPWGRS